MIKITLKDGSVREATKGSSILDVAKSISEGLARNAQCGKVNGEVKDLRTILNEDCTLEICTFDSKEGKDAVRHSVSHVLAAAVKRLFPLDHQLKMDSIMTSILKKLFQLKT